MASVQRLNILKEIINTSRVSIFVIYPNSDSQRESEAIPNVRSFPCGAFPRLPIKNHGKYIY